MSKQKVLSDYAKGIIRMEVEEVVNSVCREVARKVAAKVAREITEKVVEDVVGRKMEEMARLTEYTYSSYREEPNSSESKKPTKEKYELYGG